MLIVKPIPQIDESPSSIFLRAASLNGLEKVRYLLQFKDKNGKEPLKQGLSPSWRSPELFNSYMNALGITLPEGVSAYRQVKTIECIKVYFTEDLYLPSLIYRGEGSATCPHCLADKPYLRKIWSLKLIDICPVHRCDLVRVCPQCQWPLTWHRRCPKTCSCGFDLSTCEPTFLSMNNPDEVTEAIADKRQYSLNFLSDWTLRKERKQQRENRHR
ncbi:Hypothetical protein mma_0805 [Janthinobacterium sp. Marseille]|nr:TniQ family protein [Janthinobacterium sp. Marseille]ABR91641.1 Hypothetical protein mma_0805 [Janthinobacterium sp. Marseille]